MIMFNELSWRYWAASAVLLIAGVVGWTPAFGLVLLLSAVQVVHFALRERSLTSFPVQVRIAYLGFLAVAVGIPPLRWLIWVPTIGTPAQVLFGYCFLARTLSLLPWNRREPLSWRLVWRTFVSPPVKGAILQGQPGLR